MKCNTVIGINSEWGFSNITPLKLERCDGEMSPIATNAAIETTLLMCHRCGVVKATIKKGEWGQ